MRPCHHSCVLCQGQSAGLVCLLVITPVSCTRDRLLVLSASLSSLLCLVPGTDCWSCLPPCHHSCVLCQGQSAGLVCLLVITHVSCAGDRVLVLSASLSSLLCHVPGTECWSCLSPCHHSCVLCRGQSAGLVCLLVITPVSCAGDRVLVLSASFSSLLCLVPGTECWSCLHHCHHSCVLCQGQSAGLVCLLVTFIQQKLLSMIISLFLSNTHI